jgi:TRAP-type mannitol/chloroaromatic compound transport system permease small subunit
MAALKKFVTLVAALNTALGKAASFVIIIFMLFLSYEVICRYFFNSPTIWAHELSGFCFALYLALTGPWVLLRKEHVSVDIIYTRYSFKTKNLADIFTHLITIFFFVVLLYIGGKSALHAITTNQVSYSVWAPPLGPVRAMIPLAAMLFLLQALANLCESIIHLKEAPSK